MRSPLSERVLNDNCIVLDIPADAVSLKTAELSMALGYPSNKPPAEMEGLISSTTEEIRGLCVFRAGYVVQPLTFDASQPHGVGMGDRFFRTGKIIRSQMEGVEKAVIFICTIGPGPEQRIKKLLEQGESVQGYIADTAASVLAENTAEAVHRHLEMKFAASGLGVTNRFSPGYCGWDVREQHVLFSLLPEGFCGVRLEDSAFMQPRKSVSAMIGIGKALERADYPCAKCDDDHCLYRDCTTSKENNKKG